MQNSTSFDEESALLNVETPQQQQPRKLNVLAVTASIVATGLLAVGAYTSVKFTGSTTSVTDLGRLSTWSYTRSTNKNSDGDLRFLDRHSMVCEGSDAMVGFRVTDRIKFTYNCAQIARSAMTSQNEFRTKQVGANGLNWLDRIDDANCNRYGSNSYINAISGESPDGNFRWRIGCSSYAQKWQHCENKYTDYHDYGSAWENIYLDRHNVMCPSGSLMQSFRAETADISCGAWGWSRCNRLRFKFSCCWVDENDPTAAPISSPTSRPIALPTHKPTDKPIAEPTHNPVANPTHQPTDQPIADPTHKPVADPTHEPSKEPIAEPTKEPVAAPTSEPNAEPTFAPNVAKEVVLEANLLKEAVTGEAEAQKDVAAAETKLDDIQSDLHVADVKVDEAEKTVNDLKDSLDAHNKEIADAKEDMIVSGENTPEGEKAEERLKDAEEAAKETKEEIKDAKDELADATKKFTGLIEEKDEVFVDMSASQDQVLENINVVANIKEIVEERMKELACPFTFKQGVSKVEVPPGCVFFAANDVSFSSQKKMNAPAVYICAMDSSPVVVSDIDFKKYNLGSSVSYIQPGDETKVTFSSNQDMKGQVATFTSKTHKPLNSFKYKDGTIANDRVKTATIESATDSIPESCDALIFSSKMKLNVDLMSTKRREVSKQEKKMLVSLKAHDAKLAKAENKKD